MHCSPLRCLAVLGLATLATACEGLIAPLTGPSALRAPASASTPSPSPAPDPTAPAPTGQSGPLNLLGSWAGTTTITAGLSGIQASNVCVETWFITSQTDDTFSGTFQSNGGFTVDCGQTGTISGNFTPAGTISGLAHEVNANTGCSKLSGTPYTGTIGGTTLRATAIERLTCGTGSSTAVVNRTIVVSMTKR